MEERDEDNPHGLKVSPKERRDREITGWGWALMVCLFLANRALDLSEATLAVGIFLIICAVNIRRLVKGLRVHYLSLGIGLISLVHAFLAFIDVAWPWWYPVGAVVLLYGIAKWMLKDKIR